MALRADVSRCNCCPSDWEADECCILQTESGGTVTNRCPQKYMLSWSELKYSFTYGALGAGCTGDQPYNGAKISATIPSGKMQIGYPSELYEYDGDCRSESGCTNSSNCGGTRNTIESPAPDSCDDVFATQILGSFGNVFFHRGMSSHFTWCQNTGLTLCCSASDEPSAVGPYNLCNNVSGQAIKPMQLPGSSNCDWDGTYQYSEIKSLQARLLCTSYPL